MALLAARPLAQLAAAVVVALLLRAPGRAEQTADGEHAIKAAFLYNFTKFVDWPPDAFEGTSSPFRACVFADEAFVGRLEATLQGETVRGRPIRLERTDTLQGARGCHLLYFDGGRTAQAARLVPSLRSAAALTVGEGEGFLDQGGAIAFILENNRVRFDVNMPALDAARLSVSSKLLRVARHVERGDRR